MGQEDGNVMRWIVDKEVYNQQADLLTLAGE